MNYISMSAFKSFGIQNLYHICVVWCHHAYIEFSKNNSTHTWQNGWSCMQTFHSAHWTHTGGGSPSSHPSFPHPCPPAQFHCSSWKLHRKPEASSAAPQHSTTDFEVLCHKRHYRNDSLKACDCMIHQNDITLRTIHWLVLSSSKFLFNMTIYWSIPRTTNSKLKLLVILQEYKRKEFFPSLLMICLRADWGHNLRLGPMIKWLAY